MERMAAKQPPYGKQRAFQNAVLFQATRHVARAGRVKPADRPPERSSVLVESYGQEQQSFHAF
jgi:hypothetical protein